MRNLLKYLILVLTAATLYNAAGRLTTSVSEITSTGFFIEDTVTSDSFSSPDHRLCIPRQVQLSGSSRLNCSSRRTSNASKNISEHIRSAKTFYVSFHNSILRNSVIVNISVIEHSHKLVFLGKLII